MQGPSIDKKKINCFHIHSSSVLPLRLSSSARRTRAGRRTKLLRWHGNSRKKDKFTPDDGQTVNNLKSDKTIMDLID